jgi:hypothetical protein
MNKLLVFMQDAHVQSLGITLHTMTAAGCANKAAAMSEVSIWRRTQQ